MKTTLVRVLALSLLLGTGHAEILEVPCLAPSPMIPAGFTATAKMPGWSSAGMHVQVFTEGNCRIEEREECHPGPGGVPVCRTIRERVCDEEIEYIPFGAAVEIVEEKWVYHVREGQTPLLFAQAFKTWPYRWVVLDHGARLDFDVETERCALVLDTDVLGQGAVDRANFTALYPTMP